MLFAISDHRLQVLNADELVAEAVEAYRTGELKPQEVSQTFEPFLYVPIA